MAPDSANAIAGSSTGPGTAAGASARGRGGSRGKKRARDASGEAENGVPSASRKKKHRYKSFAHDLRHDKYVGKAYILPPKRDKLVQVAAARNRAALPPQPTEPDLFTPLDTPPQVLVPDSAPPLPNGETAETNEIRETSEIREKPKYTKHRILDSIYLSSLALGTANLENLPPDDLLYALHAHSAQFFWSHGALRCPRPQQLARPQNLKLDEIAEEAEEVEANGEEDVQIDAQANVPSLRETNFRKRREIYDRDLANPAYRRKRRVDMHTALEGSALLALGVLAEEIVGQELRRTGYVPQDVRVIEVEAEEDAAGKADRKIARDAARDARKAAAEESEEEIPLKRQRKKRKRRERREKEKKKEERRKARGRAKHEAKGTGKKRGRPRRRRGTEASTPAPTATPATATPALGSAATTPTATTP